MLDLVGNPEDWFSHNEAQIVSKRVKALAAKKVFHTMTSSSVPNYKSVQKFDYFVYMLMIYTILAFIFIYTFYFIFFLFFFFKLMPDIAFICQEVI